MSLIKRILSRPRGTQDIYPPRSVIFFWIYDNLSKLLKKNNYQQIIFPTFEHSCLFKKHIGFDNDVSKEMYSFFDRKNRELVLRPEGTLSTVRLICQNNLIKIVPNKFFYWSNMFRYERPQKGRFREFWQLGIELVGADGIIADFHILKLICDLFLTLNINKYSLKINFLGDKNIQKNYKILLKNFIIEKSIFSLLCENCKKRFDNESFLRILDCYFCKKNISFPSYDSVWTDQIKEQFKLLEDMLLNFNIPFIIDFNLVRGLDYYTGLVFELFLDQEEKAVLGGGRYNNLYNDVADKKVPSIGFALGVDRLVDFVSIIKNNKLFVCSVDVFFWNNYFFAYKEVFLWMDELKKIDIIFDCNLSLESIKKKKLVLDFIQPKILVVIEEYYYNDRCVCIKIDKNDSFELVKFENLIDKIISHLKKM